MLDASTITQTYQTILLRQPTEAETQAATDLTQTQLNQDLARSDEARELVYPIVRLYEAAFGRVPDQAGLDFWVDVLRDEVASGTSRSDALDDISTKFVSSSEFTEQYGAVQSGSSESFVRDLYNTVLRREPDQAGLDFWTSLADVNPAKVLNDFAQSSEARKDLSGATADYLRTSAEGTQDFEGRLADTDNDGAITENDNVTNTGPTGGNSGGGSTGGGDTGGGDTGGGTGGSTGGGDTGGGTGDGGSGGSGDGSTGGGSGGDGSTGGGDTGGGSGGSDNGGSTFTLTSGGDNITGTAGDDLITGGSSGSGGSDNGQQARLSQDVETGENTLTSQDTINGKGGEDTLVADLGPNTQTPSISNVERLFIDAGGATLNLEEVSGAEEIWAYRTDLFLENASLDTVFGVQELESGTLVINFETVPSGDSDTLKLASSDANATIKSGTDEQTQAIEQIELKVSGSGREDKVDVSDYGNLTKATVTGESGVILTVNPNALTEIDASGNSGGVTVDETNSTDLKITATGGSGNDVFKTGAGDDVVKGGAGDDELIVAGGANEVEGGDGDDVIKSEGGDDVLKGGAGKDEIDAGSGKDEIDGGAGADTMTGGGAGDLFKILVDGTSEESLLDTITDFNSELEDDQDRFTFGGPAGEEGNYAEAQAGGDAYADVTAKADELLGDGTVYAAVRDASGNNTFVFYDADGSGGLNDGDQGVKLMGLAELAGVGADDIVA